MGQGTLSVAPEVKPQSVDRLSALIDRLHGSGPDADADTVVDREERGFGWLMRDAAVRPLPGDQRLRRRGLRSADRGRGKS